VELTFSEPEERRAFHEAMDLLGPRANTVIYEAVLAAAKVKKASGKETHNSRLAKGSATSASRSAAASA